MVRSEFQKYWLENNSVYSETSLVVQGLRLRDSTVGATGSIPVGELRSHVPCGVAKKNKKKTVVYIQQDWELEANSCQKTVPKL